MGNNSSSRKQREEKERIEQIALEEYARRIYFQRIAAYHPAMHGSYRHYANWCEAEYQLQCIPECCRSSRGRSKGR